MRLLADENVPRPAVWALRDQGFDVISVSEDHAGSTDSEILARCASEKLTLLTLDKDFGELVFHHNLPAECGVVLFRLETESLSEFCDAVLAAVQSREDWSGFFTVVSNDRIRMRPRP